MKFRLDRARKVAAGRTPAVRRVLVWLAIAVIWPVSWAQADSLMMQDPDAAPGTPPQVFNDVQIDSVAGGKINFETSTNGRVNIDFSNVVGMTLDDEPTFNDAFRDAMANHFDRAVDEYAQTIQKTDKLWLSQLCQMLMTDAANKAGRFDKAVDGFIALVKIDPATALRHRPTIPQRGSSYLDGAASALKTAVGEPSLRPSQQETLLAFLLEVERARGDDAAVSEIGQRLAASTAASGDPSVGLETAALADARLASVRQAIEQKHFDEADALLADGNGLYVDVARRAEAMFLTAESLDGRAAATGASDQLKDAAIAYLRVVANFKNVAGAPRVADSLLAAAALLEHLNEPNQAASLDRDLITHYASSPDVAGATAQLARLSPSANTQ